MDFSKIKKIFYIVCIISMLLSIKSKVFGASYSTSYQGVTFEFNDNFNNNNPYYCLFVSDSEIYNKYYARLFRSNSPMVIDYSDSRIIVYNNNDDGLTSFFGTISSLSDYLQNNGFDNSPIPSSGNISDNDTMGVSWSCIFTNHTLYNTDGSIYKNTDIFTAPFFDNVTEIQNSDFKQLYIDLGDYSKTDNLYFHLLTVDNIQPISSTESNYYYSDKTFILNYKSKYIKQLYDTGVYYYSIPRSALSLNPDTSYVYVLNNSSNQITNSLNVITKDNNYDVVLADTSGIITADMSMNDKMQNINEELGIIQDEQNNFYNQNTINEDTETDIDTNLNFNNQNSELNNLNNGFFTRLTSMFSNLLGYDLAQDTSVSLPLPNSNKSIVLHSKIIYDNVTGALRLIINAFWVYIFSFYLWKFINKIYIAVSSGSILDGFSSSGEAITNNML